MNNKANLGRLDWVNPKHIKPSEENPRSKDFYKDKDFLRLKESVAKYGVIVPIIIKRLSKEENKKKYQLIDGERRWKAAIDTNQSLIPAYVLPPEKKINILTTMFQIHMNQEGWNAVANLVKEGKIRYGGVSNFSVEQLKRIQPILPVASLQPPYSMLKRGIEGQILDYCSKNDIGVIVYSPMQKGLLTGKMTRERIQNLPADDHRSKDPLFKDPVISNILDLVEDLRPIAENNNKTLAQLAIAWTLACPKVTAAIVGARTISQIEETVNAGNWILSKENLETIGKILGKYPPVPEIQPVKQQEKERRLLKSNKIALF